MARRWLNDTGDLHALAAARVAFGALLLLQAWEMGAELLREGYFGDHFHDPFIPEAFVPSERAYVLLLCGLAVSGVCVLVGHLARPAMFFSACAITYAMLCDRLHFHHNRWALACYVFILSFSPCDECRVLFGPRAPPQAQVTGPLWAMQLARIQVSIIDLASGGSKLLDPDWRSGAVLLDRMVRYGSIAVQRGTPAEVISFFQNPLVASIVSKGAITTELFLAFALQSRRTRLVALFVGFTFHVAIELTAAVELFGLTTMAAYLLFATPEARTRTLRYDPRRTKAVILARVVRALDWLARFDVRPWEEDAVSKSRSFVATDPEGAAATGFTGVLVIMRALPALFPLWAVLHTVVPQRRRKAGIVVIALLLVGSPARADDAPLSKAFGYSPYERETIAMIAKKAGTAVDDAPEGKIIESIRTERLDVFEKRDFLPGFLLFVNVLHATTRDHVIRREILQRQGERYSTLAMDETARNLRTLPELSLVLVIPLRGSTPDRVRVLVVTKDVWSLRLQWDVGLTTGGLQVLGLQPAVTKLLGEHLTLGGNFLYQPNSTALGGYYYIPRFEGTHVAITASANAIFNNQTGTPEGSFGSISAGQPLWNTHTEWAWSTLAAWREEITRIYSNAALAYYTSPDLPEKNAIRNVDNPQKGPGPPNGVIPYEYRSSLAQASVAVARSFGWAYKNDFTLSLEASHRQFRTFDLSQYDPAAAADFKQNLVPVSDDRAYPALEWRTYTNNFLRVLDMETYGLQEDVRLGHFIDVKVYPNLLQTPLSRSFFGVFAEAGYTWALKDGVLRLDVQTTTEANGSGVIQGVIDATSYFASPRTPIGRLVFSARVVDRYANYLNQLLYLGADTRLRGYPSSFFAGQNMVVGNLEYRSRPFEIWKVQVGGVVFWDAGEAFQSWSDFHPVHDVGFGLRALFPTFDRTVFRADVGFPISNAPLPAGVSPVTFFVTFAQAFPLPSLGLQGTSVGSLTTAATR